MRKGRRGLRALPCTPSTHTLHECQRQGRTGDEKKKTAVGDWRHAVREDSSLVVGTIKILVGRWAVTSFFFLSTGA